jgi:hypothetical protein
MARGRKTTFVIQLTPADRELLRAWQRSRSIPAGMARRGRIILLRAAGVSITDISTQVGMSRRFVYKWLRRFVQAGPAGLVDKPGRGESRRTPQQPGTASREVCR